MEDATSNGASSPVDGETVARQIARFGARLHALRSDAGVIPGKRGLSLRELARRTGLSPATLAQLEQGRHEPRLGTMLALQAALGLGSIEELLGPMPSRVLGRHGEAASNESGE